MHFFILFVLFTSAFAFPAEIKNISNNSTPSFVAPVNKPELVPVVVDPNVIPSVISNVTSTIAPEEEDSSEEEEESAEEDFRYIPGYVTDEGELLVNIKNIDKRVKFEVLEVKDVKEDSAEEDEEQTGTESSVNGTMIYS